MAGTIEGGKKAAATNIAKYGKDFYSRMGQKGGRNGHTGGFADDRIGADGLTGKERAKIAGAKGGRVSSRAGILNGQGKKWDKYRKELKEEGYL